MLFITKSREETKDIGSRLGSLLQPGDLISITGTLGAGKTAFVQGIATGLGVDDYVKSPSYTLVNEYSGRFSIYHMDLYRLEEIHDLEDIGYEEYFYGQGVTLLEWGEKAGVFLPSELLRVNIEVLTSPCEIELEEMGKGTRRITLQGEGERYSRIIEELRQYVHSRD